VTFRSLLETLTILMLIAITPINIIIIAISPKLLIYGIALLILTAGLFFWCTLTESKPQKNSMVIICPKRRGDNDA